jgi:hypothetical protein
MLMSWGQIGLVISFIWDGKYRSKFTQIIQNKRILALMGIYLLFLIGLMYTSNFSYAFHDLKIKLPLLLIPPLVYAFFPITQKEFRIIFHALFLGAIITMVAGGMMYMGWLHLKVIDMRSYSPFIAHLRVGTLLVFCIFLCIYFCYRKEYLLAPRILYVLFAAISMLFLLFIQSLTGIIAFIGCTLVITIYGLSRKQIRKPAIFVLLGFIIISATATGLIVQEYNRIHHIEKVNFSQLPKSTIHGTVYTHDTTRTETINGHYIWINISVWELRTSWMKRSKLSFDANTKKGWPVRGTLIEYLASKGLKKNAEAVESLSDKEVIAIENGVANYLNINPLDLRYRINQVFVELEKYKRNGDPNQLSFATRLETWKVGYYAIRKSWLLGYGTGDTKDAMERSYTETRSKLIPKYHLNPHQQFLTIAISIGVIGLVIFIGIVFYPLLRFRSLNILFIIAITISFISMLDEDILETQAGCTQFIFIYVLTYLFHRKQPLHP